MSEDTKQVSTNREKKEAIVAELISDVEKSKGIVFTNYQGLTHKQIEGLKNAIKPLDADIVVAKNTLLKIALEKGNVKIDESNSLDGPTATLFLFGDVITPLKSLAKTIKELNMPTIKFAVIDGKITTADDVMRLSALPSREVLLTQVAVALKSPISGLHRALNWNLVKLVMTLNAVAGAKPAMAAAAPVAEPVSEPTAEAPATETPAETTEEVAVEAPSEPATEEAKPEEVSAEQPAEENNSQESASDEAQTEGGEN